MMRKNELDVLDEFYGEAARLIIKSRVALCPESRITNYNSKLYNPLTIKKR